MCVATQRRSTATDDTGRANTGLWRQGLSCTPARQTAPVCPLLRVWFDQNVNSYQKGSGPPASHEHSRQLGVRVCMHQMHQMQPLTATLLVAALCCCMQRRRAPTVCPKHCIKASLIWTQKCWSRNHGEGRVCVWGGGAVLLLSAVLFGWLFRTLVITLARCSGRLD